MHREIRLPVIDNPHLPDPHAFLNRLLEDTRQHFLTFMQNRHRFADADRKNPRLTHDAFSSSTRQSAEAIAFAVPRTLETNDSAIASGHPSLISARHVR